VVRAVEMAVAAMVGTVRVAAVMAVAKLVAAMAEVVREVVTVAVREVVTVAVRAAAVMVAAVREVVKAVAATATAAAATAAVATEMVVHWAADRMTDAPPPGTCSGRSAGGGRWDAARVQATMLRRKMQE
jgi:hypothetical protein